jgi:hypothetical protein
VFGIYLNVYGQNHKAIGNYTRLIYNRLLMKFGKTHDNHRHPAEVV